MASAALCNMAPLSLDPSLGNGTSRHQMPLSSPLPSPLPLGSALAHVLGGPPGPRRPPFFQGWRAPIGLGGRGSELRIRLSPFAPLSSCLAVAGRAASLVQGPCGCARQGCAPSPLLGRPCVGCEAPPPPPSGVCRQPSPSARVPTRLLDVVCRSEPPPPSLRYGSGAKPPGSAVDLRLHTASTSADPP